MHRIPDFLSQYDVNIDSIMDNLYALIHNNKIYETFSIKNEKVQQSDNILYKGERTCLQIFKTPKYIEVKFWYKDEQETEWGYKFPIKRK